MWSSWVPPTAWSLPPAEVSAPLSTLPPLPRSALLFLACLPSLDQHSPLWSALLQRVFWSSLRRKPGIPGVRKQLTSSSQLWILSDTRHPSHPRTTLSKDSHSPKRLVVLWTSLGTSQWQARLSTAPHRASPSARPGKGFPPAFHWHCLQKVSLNHAGAQALSPHLAFNMSLREDFPRSTPAVLQGSGQDLDQKREMVFPMPGSESEESTVELPWACAGRCGNGVPVPRQSWLLVWDRYR